jgi:hypothetical protein
MFYEKMKRFYFVVNFFIWIVIKNYWCDVKSVKKLKCLLIDFFFRSEKGIENLTISCQTAPISSFYFFYLQSLFIRKIIELYVRTLQIEKLLTTDISFSALCTWCWLSTSNVPPLQKKLFFATCNSPRVRSLYTWRTVSHVQVAT